MSVPDQGEALGTHPTLTPRPRGREDWIRAGYRWGVDHSQPSVFFKQTTYLCRQISST